MPSELNRAHKLNDLAVMEAYGFTKGTLAFTSEAACVAELMKLYQKKAEKKWEEWMTLPKAPYNAERGYRAMLQIGEESEKNGLSDMSLDDINAEIEASRSGRMAAVK